MWPDLFFVTLLLGTILGVGLLFWILFGWSDWLQRNYSDGWAKSLVELVQLVAGVVTVFVTISATEDKPRWFHTLIAGLICVAVWRVTQFIADGKSKKIEKSRMDRLSAFEQLALQRAKLLACLQQLLRIRVERVERVRESIAMGARSSINTARPAIAPETQINDILEALVGFFQLLRPDTEDTQGRCPRGFVHRSRGSRRPDTLVQFKEPFP
jgi:hypothetical protein